MFTLCFLTLTSTSIDYLAMADTNQTSNQKSQEMKSEMNRSASGEPLPDPKSIQDLTQYVRNFLKYIF